MAAPKKNNRNNEKLRGGINMESSVIKVKEGWVVRLKEIPLEKPFHYKKDAILLQSRLVPMTKWQVENTFTLVDGHFFRRV